MKNICIFLVATFAISCNSANHMGARPGKSNSTIPPDFMYQYSIMDALQAGVYDGNLTFGALKKKGDFGIGTFNTLDGEMIMLDGNVYKMRHDGTIATVPDKDSTPLAFVKFFSADTTFTITGNGLTYADIQKTISNALNPNEMYAIKLKGTFTTMRGRSVIPAKRPYPELADYIKNGGQANFNFNNITGTCAGFLMPSFMARTNVPGYHVHFIADDHRHGGHIFDFTTNKLLVEIDHIKGTVIELNTHPDFDKTDFSKDRQKDIRKIE
ncbi:MAG TPA: acetolactate decarboxylase [Chitinophagaceae bacterium]|nr:acetolactate decarboxylase [Chitinophagaceae bacterium]